MNISIKGGVPRSFPSATRPLAVSIKKGSLPVLRKERPGVFPEFRVDLLQEFRPCLAKDLHVLLGHLILFPPDADAARTYREALRFSASVSLLQFRADIYIITRVGPRAHDGKTSSHPFCGAKRNGDPVFL